MNKKHFYVWLLFAVASFKTVLIGSASKGTYYADSKVVDEFWSDKFSDEQREMMLALLNDKELLSQASMKGTLSALEHADIDPLIANAVNAGLNQVDRKNFPEKFGKSLADGLIEGFGKNLENNKVIDDLVAKWNKAVKQGADKAAGDVNTSLGKDSKLFKAAEDTASAYANISNDFYESVVLKNMGKTGVLAVVITAALCSVPFAIRTIERNMKRPKLIIESSQLTVIEQLQALFVTPEKKKPMESMVFSPLLKKYLDDIVKIISTSHAKIKAGKTNVKYRNLMLYGPPGTGKTMFAKELARCSGLEFACMSGSSFAKFQEGEAIEALDELFAWAKKCNGLMIFIDEAETFLSKRENMDPQSKSYQLLNNFLNYTGQRSSNFMIVFATNHKDVLDSAMYRRIDDLIEMPLPSKKQRIDTLVLYKNKILMDSKQNEKTLTNSVSRFLTPAVLEQIADDTKGLSYGELEGIMNNIKTEADILDNPAVNADLIKTVVCRVVKKHQDFTGGKYLGSIED